MSNRERVHIKLGSKCVANGDGLNYERLSRIGEKTARLDKVYYVSITSSGAVAKGKQIFKDLGKDVSQTSLKAIAAAGSAGVIEDLSEAFRPHGLILGQVPVIHQEIRSVKQSRNLLAAYKDMEAAGMIPVSNNNDILTRGGDKKEELEKIKVGADNDWLAADLAHMTGAKVLLLCTTGVQGFEIDGKVQHQIHVDDIDALKSYMHPPNEEGTGSMESKVRAAAWALELSGAAMDVFICNVDADYERIVAGEKICTQVIQ